MKKLLLTALAVAAAAYAIIDTAIKDHREGLVKWRDPLRRFKTLSEAAEAGFPLDCPESFAGAQAQQIGVFNDSWIQVSYFAADEPDCRLLIRKGPAEQAGEDSDYYPHHQQITLTDGRIISAYGDAGDAIKRASWESGGFTYDIDAVNYPLTRRDLSRLADQIH